MKILYVIGAVLSGIGIILAALLLRGSFVVVLPSFVVAVVIWAWAGRYYFGKKSNQPSSVRPHRKLARNR